MPGRAGLGGHGRVRRIMNHHTRFIVIVVVGPHRRDTHGQCKREETKEKVQASVRSAFSRRRISLESPGADRGRRTSLLVMLRVSSLSTRERTHIPSCVSSRSVVDIYIRGAT